jgi:hypothetical protein
MFTFGGGTTASPGSGSDAQAGRLASSESGSTTLSIDARNSFARKESLAIDDILLIIAGFF